MKRKKGYFGITAHNNQPLGCVIWSWGCWSSSWKIWIKCVDLIAVTNVFVVAFDVKTNPCCQFWQYTIIYHIIAHFTDVDDGKKKVRSIVAPGNHLPDLHRLDNDHFFLRSRHGLHFHINPTLPLNSSMIWLALHVLPPDLDSKIAWQSIERWMLCLQLGLIFYHGIAHEVE